jgi:hypothetical protein
MMATSFRLLFITPHVRRKAHQKQRHFATENTEELTETCLEKRYSAFLVALGDLGGEKNLMH